MWGQEKKKKHRDRRKNKIVKRDFSRFNSDEGICNRVRKVLQQKMNGAQFSNFSDLNDLLHGASFHD